MNFTDEQIEEAARTMSVKDLTFDARETEKVTFCKKVINEVLTHDGPYLRYGAFRPAAIAALRQAVERKP